MDAEETREFAAACELLGRSPALRGSSLLRVQKLAGDASGRRYRRLFLSAAAPRSTVILMLLAGTRGPVAHGRSWDQDQAFVALAPFLKARHLRVPEILAEGLDCQALLVEDFGDVALHHFAFDQLTPEGQAINARLGGGDTTLLLYRKAVDALVALQAIPIDAACPVAERSMEYEEYRIEAQRFIDHYLVPHGRAAPHIELVQRSLDELCRAVAAHPRRLMYRDFMPWNIQVLPDGELGFLDFQDMLVGSTAYDLVSLLHDRDVDFALGPARCRALIDYFIEQSGLSRDFWRHYHQVLVQRHLRLAGQFHLLTQRTGRPIYETWVPGCLRRAGRSLAALPELSALLEVLAAEIPEVRAGAEDRRAEHEHG